MDIRVKHFHWQYSPLPEPFGISIPKEFSYYLCIDDEDKDKAKMMVQQVIDMGIPINDPNRFYADCYVITTLEFNLINVSLPPPTGGRNCPETIDTFKISRIK